MADIIENRVDSTKLAELIKHAQAEIDKRISMVDDVVKDCDNDLASDLSEEYKEKIRKKRADALKIRSDWQKERERVVGENGNIFKNLLTMVDASYQSYNLPTSGTLKFLTTPHTGGASLDFVLDLSTGESWEHAMVSAMYGAIEGGAIGYGLGFLAGVAGVTAGPFALAVGSIAVGTALTFTAVASWSKEFKDYVAGPSVEIIKIGNEANSASIHVLSATIGSVLYHNWEDVLKNYPHWKITMYGENHSVEYISSSKKLIWHVS